MKESIKYLSIASFLFVWASLHIVLILITNASAWFLVLQAFGAITGFFFLIDALRKKKEERESEKLQGRYNALLHIYADD